MNWINHLSSWAYRHPYQAIPLIILMEITNVFIGITVGSALLNGSSPWVLMGMLVVGMVLTKNLRHYTNIQLVDLASHARFVFQKRAFFCLFCLNMLIYTVTGGILGHMVTNPEGTANLYGSLSSASETVSGSISGDYKVPLWEKMHKKALLRATKPAADNTIHRIGYFALFLLGLGLAYIGAFLSCSVLCSGYGAAAVLVFLITIGVFAGGFYFFGRGIDRNMKPYKEMTRDERTRERRRYLRTLAGTVVALGLFILIAGISS